MSVKSQQYRAWPGALLFDVALTLLVGFSHGRSLRLRSPDSLPGVWGGDGIQMTIEAQGAAVEFDCGIGSVDEAIIPDADGRFQAQATIAPAAGLEPPPAQLRQAALHRGSVADGSMELTVTVIDTGTSLGPFSLKSGDQGRAVLCA